MISTAKTWKLFPQNPGDCQKIGALLNIHPIVAQILLNRQISSVSEAKDFLNPSLNKQDNFDADELTKTAEIIESVLKKNGKILVYGDYDADGVTATAILTLALRELGAAVEPYIPHRFTEGYSLNLNTVDKLLNKNFDLIITVDCGISNLAEIQKIKEKSKTKVIIMDHHNIPSSLPPA
ncbi:DHH family phosphoesterase, partial [Candidatus Margulisiibacteriota bacterium]